MSAIITDTFRRSNAKTFVDDIVSTSSPNKYFIGIGRSDRWDANEDTTYVIPSSTGGYSDSLEVLNNLQALQKIGSSGDTAKIVIPNVALTAGEKYKTYNSHDSSCFLPDTTNNLLPCYGLRVATTNSSFLYMCVGKDSATTTLAAAPTGTGYDIQTVGTSGNTSHWVLVQEITSLSSDLFVEIRTTALTATTSPTATIVKAGSGGALTGLHVINGGRYPVGAALSGYLYLSDDSTVDYGSSVISINITTSSEPGYQVITSVSLPVGVNNYKGIIKGSVRIISTGIVTPASYPAIVAPIIAPSGGFGYNPFDVMPSWFASLQATLSAIGGDSFYNSYRQISVIKNPNGVAVANTYNALKYLGGGSITGGTSLDFAEGVLLCQTRANVGGNAADNLNGRITVVGVVDNYDSTYSKLYYHQNYWSGFSELSTTALTVTAGTMDAHGKITLGSANMTYTISPTLDNAEITDSATTFSRGDVLFVENRRKITRSSTQTENIKIIIQF